MPIIRRSVQAWMVALLGPSLAHAGLLPVSVSVMPEAGKFRFTYAIVLPGGSQLRAGDYFTIYDFAGYQADSAVYSPAPDLGLSPHDWTVSVNNTGLTPDRLIPEDNPGLPNLTWTYSGPTIPTGQTGLGNFWAISIYGETTEGPFTARTHRTSDGKWDSNITDTRIPVPTPPAPPVPEPSTWLLASLALPWAWWRRRQARPADEPA